MVARPGRSNLDRTCERMSIWLAGVVSDLSHVSRAPLGFGQQAGWSRRSDLVRWFCQARKRHTPRTASRPLPVATRTLGPDPWTLLAVPTRKPAPVPRSCRGWRWCQGGGSPGAFVLERDARGQDGIIASGWIGADSICTIRTRCKTLKTPRRQEGLEQPRMKTSKWI